MKKLKTVMLGLLVIVAGAASAQKVTQTEGNASVLKGQKKVNVEFVYDDFSVGKEKESDYVARKVKEYNEKEAGRGDKWKNSWISDRKGTYEPQFFELFNKYSGGIQGGAFTDAKYTLIVKIKRIEPGFNVYVMKKYAELDVEISVVETANKGKVLAKIKADKAPGRTYGLSDMDTGVRIGETFAMLGKTFGKWLTKLK